MLGILKQEFFAIDRLARIVLAQKLKYDLVEFLFQLVIRWAVYHGACVLSPDPLGPSESKIKFPYLYHYTQWPSDLEWCIYQFTIRMILGLDPPP